LKELPDKIYELVPPVSFIKPHLTPFLRIRLRKKRGEINRPTKKSGITISILVEDDITLDKIKKIVSVFLPSLDYIFRTREGFGVFFQVVEHMEDLPDMLEHPVFIYYHGDGKGQNGEAF
jgi:hypothetical protein